MRARDSAGLHLARNLVVIALKNENTKAAKLAHIAAEYPVGIVVNS